MTFKALIALAVLAASQLVSAQQAVTVTEVEDRQIQTKRGTYNVGPRVLTQEACLEEMRKDTRARGVVSLYTCNPVKVFRTALVTIPAAPASSQSQACPQGTTGTTWTQTRSVTRIEEAPYWQTSEWAPATAPAAACPPVPPPVVCPAAPASTQTQSCPSGTTGAPWTQTRVVLPVANPTSPSACFNVGAWTPTAAPAGACTPIVVPPPPPPPGTTVFHFSDCQAGAVAECVPGSNANPGTLALPKQNLAGINLNGLPAGTQLLFKRGGAWTNMALRLENLNATTERPLTFDAYGDESVVKPLFNTPSGPATFQLGGNWGNTSNDGGYLIRNIRMVNTGAAERGIWLVQNVHSMTFDGVEISGFPLALESSQLGSGVRGLTIRNSKIFRNTRMGLLGAYNDSLIENNVFEENNFSGSALNHGIYYSGGRNTTIRGNHFLRNSVISGICRGGNLTAHGMIENLTIENNVIEQDNSVTTCYGISMNPGYSTAEGFRGLRIVGNTVINVGGAAISASAAPGAIIENNRVIRTVGVFDAGMGAWHQGISTGASDDAQDLPPGGEIVRNNVGCYSGTAQGLAGSFLGLRSGTATGNVVRTGADASTGACAR